ncbi:uncharacterized protein B0H64DRAFT_475177 [Chaetomium fimeti]|uniref:Uncharacterized protein n=1 Tax=Chaetomium fimeti TaxID=1854472 RepID=A0AAE0LT56_9PEZI|nr:hypothetical protein B0H64DRAFT_475177 [Chaetomium fimeti]
MPTQPPNPPPHTHTHTHTHTPHPPTIIKPSPMRNLSEFAVADTPGTAGPEYPAATDYLQSRFVPVSASPLQRGDSRNSDSDADVGADVDVDGGRVRLLSDGGGGGGDGDGWEGDGDGDVDAGVDMQREMGMGMGMGEGSEGKGGGEVDGGVEGGTRRVRVRRGSMSVVGGDGGGGGGGGLGVGRVAVRRVSPGGFHGRGRGEVTLGSGEADLERKKQQHAAARKQVRDARKRGEDVDGRETTGPSGRQPGP